MDIHYVTDNEGERIAVQVPLEQWEIIKAELESYDDKDETTEIMADTQLVKSIQKGRSQANQKMGRRVEEIDV